MKKRMLIDATQPEETRVVLIGDRNKIEDFDFEAASRKQLKGNIYLARVTRVEPSLQAAFVEYGGNRHGFLAFGEIHPDYYRIPMEDREALLAEEAAASRAAAEEDDAYDDEDGEDDEDEAEAVETAGAASIDEPVDDEDDAVEASDDQGGDVSADIDADEDAPVVVDVDYEEVDAGAETVAQRDDDEAPAAAVEDEEEDEESSVDASGDDDPVAVQGEEDTESPEADVASASDESEDDAAPESGSEEGSAGAESEDSTTVAASAAVEEVSEQAPRPRRRRRRRPDSAGGDSGDMDEERAARRRMQRRYKIQEVVTRRQIMLVQVVKEERGNKGAALTTYLSLAGRYCVLMPNTPRGGGVSRKITSAGDRKRLKGIVEGLDVPEGMAVIVRTAGSERTKTEIKRDYEYLLRLWDEIRESTLQSTAPCLIYEEANLIKRSIRDLYARDIDEVLVEGDEGYKTAKGFMKTLVPSHAKRVQPYKTVGVPLFQRYQVESQLDAIHSPTVQLRSGGYIVINETEALVAIDVNSGRATRERNIEETATRTNLEAAEEIARQLRLRDLAGLVVIDFIDMEENRNQSAVERRFKDAMKSDRARIQVGRISHFGLLELSRQRLRPSIGEASSMPCPHCGGTGRIRSTESMALHVLRAIEEEGMRQRASTIAVHLASSVGFYIMNKKRDALIRIEERYGMAVMLEPDDALVPPELRIERLESKPAHERIRPTEDLSPSMEIDDDVDDVEEEDEETGEKDEERRDRRRRAPRRRRRRGGSGNGEGRSEEQAADSEDGGEASEDGEPQDRAAADGDEEDGGRKRRRRGRRGGRRRGRRDQDDAVDAVADSGEGAEGGLASGEDVTDAGEGPAPEAASGAEAPEEVAEAMSAETETVADEAPEQVPQEPEASEVQPEGQDAVAEVAEAHPEEPVTAEEPEPESADVSGGEAVDQTEAEAPEADAEEPKSHPLVQVETVEKPSGPPRRGWWNRLTS